MLPTTSPKIYIHCEEERGDGKKMMQKGKDGRRAGKGGVCLRLGKCQNEILHEKKKSERGRSEVAERVR